MENFSIDIVSDLHIDQWDPAYKIKYKCGEVKDKPLNWETLNIQNKILIIAGDISDDLDRSVKYLDDVSNYYDQILFVDGNHEHVNNYPNLYSNQLINKKIQNPKVSYLSENTFVKNGVAFIGTCGWWDNKSTQEYTYFKEWIPHLTKEQNMEFCDNVKEQAKIQADEIENRLKVLEQDRSIKTVVIVTHCVPLLEFCDIGSENTELNKHFTEILKKKYSKLKCWVFGHTHQHFNKEVNGVLFRANGRGRPEDWNREQYKLSKI